MTLVTLRPDSQDFLLAVTRVPNVSAELNLNDSPVDVASYVHGTIHAAGLRCGLTTYTLAAGERIRYVTPRAVVFHAVGGPRQYVHVRLRDSLTGAQTTLWQLGTVYGTPGIEGTGAKQPAGPGGVPWSQALISRLQFDVAWLDNGGGAGFLRLAEAYVDLDVNAQPVVSAVTASGTTTSTRPAWSFTYADADTDPQTRYRVKVFSAEQYGAAGFTPDGSVATWDSGELSGNITSGTVGVDLPTGVTYKLYAKAAQAWPGPEGALWWSAWASSSTFSIVLTPPLTPSLTVTAQPGVPEYRVKLDVVAPLNLMSVDQADFETSSPPTDWFVEANCTLARSTTNPANGVGCMTMTATAAANMSAQLGVGAFKLVAGGAQYTALARFRAAVTGRSVRVKIRWHTRAVAVISTDTGSSVADTTAGYTQATVTATAPATAVYAQVILEVLAPAAAEVHRVDMVSLHRGAGTTWTQGDMFTTDQIVVERMERVWPEYRGASRNWAIAQIASGGGLVRTADGFTSRVLGEVTSVPLDVAPVTGAGSAGQARMIVWRPITAVGSFLDIGAVSTVSTDMIRTHMAPAVVGLQTRWALWAKVKTGTFACRLFAYSTTADNTVVTTANSGVVTLNTTFQRITVDITPGAGSVWLRGAVENNTPTAEAEVCVTAVRVCPTAADDGTTPAGEGVWFPEWVPVRPVDTPTAAAPGETFTLYDHEPPPGRPIGYRVSTISTVSGETVASPPSEPVFVLMDPPTRTILKSAEPENAMPVQIARGDTWERTEDAAVFHPLGRDLDPVLVRDWRSGRDGQFVAHALSDLELYRLQQLLPSATPLLIQWSEGGQTYARVTGFSSTRVVRGFHRLTVAYVETMRPVS